MARQSDSPEAQALTADPGWVLTQPRAETVTHHITFGFDPDPDVAARQAVSEMIDHLTTTLGLSPALVYSLCSLAVDLHVTQVVNKVRGVHAMLPKSVLTDGLQAVGGKG